uniref:Histone acetyltransferase n=1 Tax=Ananas comosus var. bracteatus TaxID=296719 RepID=A0A6V7NVA7_ANACO|nr:unnamed protein product [Ananas comosus var. bracteatus]
MYNNHELFRFNSTGFLITPSSLRRVRGVFIRPARWAQWRGRRRRTAAAPPWRWWRATAAGAAAKTWGGGVRQRRRRRRRRRDGGAAAGGGDEGDVSVEGPEAPPRQGHRAPQDLLRGANDYEYYVHYTINRRLDEWVKLEQLDLDTVESDIDEKVEDKATSLKMTRHQKRKIDETHVEQGHEELDAASLREHEEFTKVKNIAKIELGRYEIDTWYFSPFPPEYNDSPKLYFCEFCLNFMKRKEQLQRHMRKCDLKHPPGDEIYRSGTLSMFEVDGKKNKVYGQNLCYLAKLFLDHKTLYYDVDLFLFYVFVNVMIEGATWLDISRRRLLLVGPGPGYNFSKPETTQDPDDPKPRKPNLKQSEKHSEESYNLACILTLPPYQRKGYGKFLIAFSYELSKKEGKVGTPERPLSDLGLLSYRGYWTRVLLEILKKHKSNISIKELSDMTAIKADDILSTLQSLDLIQYRKGQHVICADPKVLDRHLKAAGRGGLEVDVSKLIWTPYKEQS